MLLIAIISAVLAAVIGYLLGSINSSLIVGKFKGVDIKKHGSGNAGMTNTLRVLGKKAAVLVLIGDLLKGVISYLAGFYLFKDIIPYIIGFLVIPEVGGMIGGLGAILGHNWPVYFGFKGGRGVLTSLAVLLMADWRVALASLGVFIIIVAVTRYVSLGSIISAALLPVISALLGRDTLHIIFSLIISLLIITLHNDNIKRLLKGTESKLGSKKRGG